MNTTENQAQPSIWDFKDYNEYMVAYHGYLRNVGLPDFCQHGLELCFGSSIIAKMAELNETNPHEAQELHHAVETIKRVLPNL